MIDPNDQKCFSMKCFDVQEFDAATPYRAFRKLALKPTCVVVVVKRGKWKQKLASRKMTTKKCICSFEFYMTEVKLWS